MSSPEEVRPARMWRLMPPDLRVSAASAFWADEQAALEQAEAAALIARQIKFRPKSVYALSVDRKARHLAGITQISDLLAARLLISYHLEHKRPMMGAFLDALGIAHEDGLIKDESPKTPDAETLDNGVTTLAAAYPKADVARYFWALLWQDSDTWGGLKGRPELALEQHVPPFDKHLFICCNRREPGNAKGSCDPAGSEALQKAFKKALAARGLTRRIRANKSGCLDQCEFGPTVVVYPDAVWYSKVTEADVDEIIDEHIIGGRPVERLRLPERATEKPVGNV